MTFDGTVSLGNILTMTTIIAAAIISWSRLSMKIEQHQQWIVDHEECSDNQRKILIEVRESLSYLRGRADQKREDGK